MSEISMKHLEYLSDVATADVSHLMEKEKTYRGSWKRRGGIGAFMMLARKWDRLENILGSLSSDKYDVFHIMQVESETGKSGSDGSVLAEIRDLRRYLLLVEAEMVARGVVPTPQLVATKTFDHDDDIRRKNEILASMPMKELGLQVDTSPLPSPGNGSHHSTLTPWLVSMRWRDKHSMMPGQSREKLFDAWWRQVSPGVWALEPYVQESDVSMLPVEVADMYISTSHGWRIMLDDCPPDAREYFPSLQYEVNEYERRNLSEWQQDLYVWDDGEGKWRVPRPLLEAWIAAPEQV